MEQWQTGCSFVIWPNSVQALWANSWLSFDDNASWDKNKSFLQYTTRDHWIIFLQKIFLKMFLSTINTITTSVLQITHLFKKIIIISSLFSLKIVKKEHLKDLFYKINHEITFFWSKWTFYIDFSLDFIQKRW